MARKIKKFAGPTFSELARKAKLPRHIERLAKKMGKEMAEEFNRRLKENIGLYRPRDDER